MLTALPSLTPGAREKAYFIEHWDHGHLLVKQDRGGWWMIKFLLGMKCKMQVNFLQERESLTLQPDDE